MIVSQVVPFPWDTSLEVVGDYQAAQKAIDPTLTPDFVSLEGYLSGRLAAVALELIGPNPTRAALLQIINDIGRFDIGGNIITFGDKTREEPPKVFLTVIQPDGSFKPVDRLSKDPAPEVGLQELFLRSSATEKPEANKPPDRREEANARVQDCGADAARSSPDGTQCDQNRASTVAVAVRTGPRQEQASRPTVTASLHVSRNAAAPRQVHRAPQLQHAAKSQHRIVRALPHAAERQPAPPLAKAAYSFAFGSSCSCATRGF